MIKRFVFGMVEVPGLILLAGCTLMAVGLIENYTINLGVSLLFGAVLMGFGVQEGRRQVTRLIAIEQWKAAVVTLPRMIETLEDDAPEELRAMLQARLREAKEGLAHES